jgi:hypothetical protein
MRAIATTTGITMFFSEVHPEAQTDNVHP